MDCQAISRQSNDFDLILILDSIGKIIDQSKSMLEGMNAPVMSAFSQNGGNSAVLQHLCMLSQCG